MNSTILIQLAIFIFITTHTFFILLTIQEIRQEIYTFSSELLYNEKEIEAEIVINNSYFKTENKTIVLFVESKEMITFCSTHIFEIIDNVSIFEEYDNVKSLILRASVYKHDYLFFIVKHTFQIDNYLDQYNDWNHFQKYHKDMVVFYDLINEMCKLVDCEILNLDTTYSIGDLLILC